MFNPIIQSISVFNESKLYSISVVGLASLGGIHSCKLT